MNILLLIPERCWLHLPLANFLYTYIAFCFMIRNKMNYCILLDSIWNSMILMERIIIENNYFWFQHIKEAKSFDLLSLRLKNVLYLLFRKTSNKEKTIKQHMKLILHIFFLLYHNELKKRYNLYKYRSWPLINE